MRRLLLLALAAGFVLVYALAELALSARVRRTPAQPGPAAQSETPAPAALALPTLTPSLTSTPAATATGTPTPTPTVTPYPTFVAPPLVRDRPLRVFIDPGHGGPDAGAVHVDAAGQLDLIEKDVDLDIALRLADLLRAAGHEVLLSRSDDRGVTPSESGRLELYARVDMANEAGADLFISVHNNGHNDRSLRGTEVYYCQDRPYSAENIRLAVAVQTAIVQSLRRAGYETVDRGARDDTTVYRGHMGVLGPRIARPTLMVAILGESLFMTNDDDAAQLARPEIRQAIAQGYADGIRAYLQR